MDFNKDFFADCIGAVTILTDDLVVFQGQIIRDERHKCFDDDKFDKCCRPEFVVLKLTCDPAIIDDHRIKETCPDLFEEGDKIRINVDKIIAVGPSRCCLGEKKEEKCDKY